jgi:uncharacterized OsmC-like protein
MATADIAAALQRFGALVRRRPAIAVHDDPPARTRWQGGLRFVATHANGTEVVSDMVPELGGAGDQVSPGWLFRAGFASCTATAIAMTAAAEGIELETLELEATSRSDAHAVLGLSRVGDERIPAGPFDVQLFVRASARGVSPERLRALIEEGYRRSPAAGAMEAATPVALHIEIEPG